MLEIEIEIEIASHAKYPMPNVIQSPNALLLKPFTACQETCSPYLASTDVAVLPSP